MKNVLIEKIEARDYFLCQTSFFNELQFEKSFAEFLQIQRMISRFINSGALNEKLILNKLIILFNNFEREFVIRKLWQILDKDNQEVLKSFLKFLKLINPHECADVVTNRVADDVLENIKTRYHLP